MVRMSAAAAAGARAACEIYIHGALLNYEAQDEVKSEIGNEYALASIVVNG